MYTVKFSRGYMTYGNETHQKADMRIQAILLSAWNVGIMPEVKQPLRGYEEKVQIKEKWGGKLPPLIALWNGYTISSLFL